MKISCLSYLVAFAILGIALGRGYYGGGGGGLGFGGGGFGGGGYGGGKGGGGGGGIFGILIFLFVFIFLIRILFPTPMTPKYTPAPPKSHMVMMPHD